MSATLVTYEEAKARIGALPSVLPRLDIVNLRHLETALVDKVSCIPLQ